MSEFAGKKTELLGSADLDTSPVEVFTKEYVSWLEQQLSASRHSISSLRLRLEQYTKAENHRLRYEQDYLPYADDDRYD